MPEQESAASVLDASAVLCFLLDEPGAATVEERLEHRAAISAANWSEVAQKTLGHRRNWQAARGLLLGYDLVVEPVLAADAERAAELWIDHPHLALADRLCLASGLRLEAIVWTADRTWGESERVRQVR
jgi:ribonuclease VapC